MHPLFLGLLSQGALCPISVKGLYAQSTSWVGQKTNLLPEKLHVLGIYHKTFRKTTMKTRRFGIKEPRLSETFWLKSATFIVSRILETRATVGVRVIFTNTTPHLSKSVPHRKNEDTERTTR